MDADTLFDAVPTEERVNFLAQKERELQNLFQRIVARGESSPVDVWFMRCLPAIVYTLWPVLEISREELMALNVREWGLPTGFRHGRRWRSRGPCPHDVPDHEVPWLVYEQALLWNEDGTVNNDNYEIRRYRACVREV